MTDSPTDDGAVTAAELDELEATLREQRSLKFRHEEKAADALASLRKQLDDTRVVLVNVQSVLFDAQTANAKKDAALRSVARWATDEKLTAAERVNIIAHQPQVRALTPASQEAPASPAADAILTVARAITPWIAGCAADAVEAAVAAISVLTPASPSPGLDMMFTRDPAIRAAWDAWCASPGGRQTLATASQVALYHAFEQGFVFHRSNAAPASPSPRCRECGATSDEGCECRPASPSPGLRDVLAEFERRTKAIPVGHEIASRGASTYNWRRCHLDEFREIAASLSRPISEREGE